MRSIITRALIATAAGIAAIGAVIAVVVWPSHCPIQLGIVGVEPSGIYDERRSESSLCYIALSNRDNVRLSLNTKTVEFEARVGRRYVTVPRASSVAGVPPGRLSGIAILVPAGADACRMRFTYQYWPRPGVEERLLGWAFGSFPKLYRTPVIGRWMFRRYFSIQFSGRPSAPHWRNALTPEVVLPKEPDQSYQSR